MLETLIVHKLLIFWTQKYYLPAATAGFGDKKRSGESPPSLLTWYVPDSIVLSNVN